MAPDARLFGPLAGKIEGVFAAYGTNTIVPDDKRPWARGILLYSFPGSSSAGFNPTGSTGVFGRDGEQL